MNNKLSRRDFLKSSGLAGTGLALGGLGSVRSPPKARRW